ncbi:MAG TPA: hypothetical protein VIN05_08445 [Roseovarius sp.]
MMNRREHSVMRPGAILSRLFLVLALALFGALQVDAGRANWTFSPAAAPDTPTLSAILTAQATWVRGQLPQDDTPDFTLPALADPETAETVTLAASHEQAAPHSPFSIHILPPVRGPPAV